MIEVYTDCCSIDNVINRFATRVKEVIKEIKRTPNHFFSEMKIGLDERYSYKIGKLHEGVFYPNDSLLEVTQQYVNDGLLSEEELLMTEIALKERNNDAFDIVNKIWRDRKLLRWSEDEILAGYKKLTGSIVIRLEQALRQHTPVKIDLITSVNDKFVEITNFLMLAVEKENEIIPINILISTNPTLDKQINNVENLDVYNDIDAQLPSEIEKLYYSNMYYSPFKMVKRMFSFSRHTGNKVILDKIIPIISGHISLMYQIKSELDAISIVLEKGYYPFQEQLK